MFEHGRKAVCGGGFFGFVVGVEEHVFVEVLVDHFLPGGVGSLDMAHQSDGPAVLLGHLGMGTEQPEGGGGAGRRALRLLPRRYQWVYAYCRKGAGQY